MVFINQLTNFMYAHISSVSVAIVATLCAVYGDYLNLLIRRHVTGTVWRFIIYVLIFAVGLGFVSSLLVDFLTWAAWLLPGKSASGFNFHYLITPLVVVIFVVLGVLAKSQKQL
jgi:hypothetical protein